jgi:hypothetical protein
MFELSLHVQQDALAAALPGEVSDTYSLDTAEVQLVAACELIADAGVADFQLACCGAQRWPVDVRTDLSVFLEQLQALLHSLCAVNACAHSFSPSRNCVTGGSGAS